MCIRPDCSPDDLERQAKPKASHYPVVHVRYVDHTFFRDSEYELFRPGLRECIGWMVRDEPDFITVVWERSITPQHGEKALSRESGAVILRSDILGMRQLG